MDNDAKMESSELKKAKHDLKTLQIIVTVLLIAFIIMSLFAVKMGYTRDKIMAKTTFLETKLYICENPATQPNSFIITLNETKNTT